MIPRVVALAWKSIMLHRLRSFLTVLGIIVGVVAVIAMLAIGEGASEAAQEQIRRMGSRNLLLASVQPPQSDSAASENRRVLEYGLKHDDFQRIVDTVPEITRIVARRDIPVDARVGTRKYTTVVMGTSADYADVANLRMRHGRFLTAADAGSRRTVCVLGAKIAERFFRSQSPVGQRIRLARHYFDVVGVLAPRGEGTGGTGGTGGESDDAVFVPLQTMKERWGDIVRVVQSGSRSYTKVQLHRITVEAANLDAVRRIARSLSRMLDRWHPYDVKLTVPLDLLEEAKRTKRRYNLILGFIAGFSLLVGGIGIMNIMLATVVERTREIGIRRALGAKRSHIIRQFLAETVLLSVSGGLIGLALGVLAPMAISHFAGMPTVVTPFSLILAFGISAGVGVVFGLYPAAQAADLDPVVALRRE
ncbi:MAG: ABC transporter permease [Planctomycetota bacterium]|nr:ABC transporter permease [Planctomycetota bacterium]